MKLVQSEMEMTERLMADIAALDPVYVDGIAGLVNLGTNFGTVYFRFIPIKSENGLIMYEKTPVLYLVRPRSGGCQAPTCDYMRILDRCGPTSAQPFAVTEGVH
jgi:hypothetical protein